MLMYVKSFVLFSTGHTFSIETEVNDEFTKSVEIICHLVDKVTIKTQTHACVRTTGGHMFLENFFFFFGTGVSPAPATSLRPLPLAPVARASLARKWNKKM